MGESAIVALEILIRLTEQATVIAGMLNKAAAEKRDITKEEIDMLKTADDLAKKKLQDLIDKA